jgi:hypothetical protein
MKSTPHAHLLGSRALAHPHAHPDVIVLTTAAFCCSVALGFCGRRRGKNLSAGYHIAGITAKDSRGVTAADVAVAGNAACLGCMMWLADFAVDLAALHVSASEV